MRRRLLLLRHAKSSWDDMTLDDHDRPLSGRGERSLQRVSADLADRDHLPDLVLCSSSRRTTQTLDGIREVIPASTTIDVREDLYLADADRLLDLVHTLPADVRTAMIIAHNPGMEDLATLLVGSGDDALRRQLATKYPTGALATLSFDGPWAELAPGAARLDSLFLPRPTRPPDAAAP